MHLYSVLMVIHNIQLSGNFREKREKNTLANSEKNFRGV